MKLKHKTYVAIAKGRELLFIIYRNINTVEEHAPTIWAIERTDNLQQRGLTCATGTYYTNYLALIDGEVNTLEHL